jgi:ubiquinone biosynthesis protein
VSVLSWPRPVRHLNRFRQVAAVLIRYGFGELVARLPKPVRRGIRSGGTDTRLGLGERLRSAFEELGPTFIKLGQFLASRPLAIPPDVAAALARLEDAVPPADARSVFALLEREWHGAPDPRPDVTAVPFAAASLACAYAARLPDGRDVVVKVQRPKIDQIVRTDLEILADLAAWAERNLPELRVLSPVRTVEQLRHSLGRELDFAREARHIEIFRHNFHDHPSVHIPEVIWPFTTGRVLTTTYVEGIKISDLDGLRREGYDLAEVARVGGALLFEQIFERGFYHADPHPGNIFVMPGPRIAYIDFGLVGYLTGSIKRHLASLLAAAVSRDARRMVRAFEEIGALPQRADRIALEHDLTEFIYRYHQVPLAQVSLQGVLSDLYWVVDRHHLQLRPELLLLLKTLSQYDRLARALDPQWDLVEQLRPYADKLSSAALDLGALPGDLLEGGGELRRWLTELPFELRQFLRQLRRGELSLEIRSDLMNDLTAELDRASNRISFALLVAGLAVGSALLLRLDVGWKVFGLSVLGLVGLTFAGFLCVSLLIGILRSGRL